jgi:hypothetical protein
MLPFSAGFTFVAQSVEMFRDTLPAIAPVLNQTLKYTERGTLAARGDMLDTAQEFWHVPELGDVGQKSAYLELGMDAGFKLAEGF